MKYSFTFDTLQAYKNAKNSETSAASGGHPIYDVLSPSGSGVTNSDGALSRTAISTIKETGQTLIDSVNIIVPREQGGEVGDTLLYNTEESKYYWLKGAWPFNHDAANVFPIVTSWKNRLGSNCCTYNSSKKITLSSDYKIIGFVGYREANRCLIFGDITRNSITGVNSCPTFGPDTSNAQKWDTRAAGSEILNMKNWIQVMLTPHTAGQIEQVFFSLYYKEQQIDEIGTVEGARATLLPISRAAWERTVSAIYNKTTINDENAVGVCGWNGNNTVLTKSGTGYGKIEVSNGVGTITYYSSSSSTGVAINPAQWDYDYDKWANNYRLPRIPSTDGAFTEKNGRNNTAIIIADGESYHPAAKGCKDHAVSGVDDFSAGKWWMPSILEMFRMSNNYRQLFSKGYRFTQSMWTSTAGSKTSAWVINYYTGGINVIQKDNAERSTLPVTEFII